MDTDYTIICSCYEQGDRIERFYNHWMCDQSLPPREIIVVDDGSETTIPTLPKIRTLSYPHSGHLTRLLNLAVEKVETYWFIFLEPSITASKDFMKLNFERIQEKWVPIGMYARSDDPNKFGPIEHVSEEHGEVINRIPFPAAGFLVNKDTFLWFNESYTGLGKWDDDYMVRCTMNGQHFVRYKDMVLYHWNHPNASWMKNVERDYSRNGGVLHHALEYYRKTKNINLKDNRYHKNIEHDNSEEKWISI